MIQFNLLPDVKKDYIRARRTKRIVGVVAGITIVASTIITGLLYSVVQIGQKQHISNLTDDIATKQDDISKITDLDKIMTIQNQLNSLQAIHETKPEVARLFNYFNQLTPALAKISTIEINFTGSTLTLSGTADSLSTINQFADTLKFSKFVSAEEPDIESVIFTNVSTQMSRASDSSTYSIDVSFDPTIFSNTRTITLRVPDTVTTRSVLNSPDVNTNGLFDSAPLGGGQ